MLGMTAPLHTTPRCEVPASAGMARGFVRPCKGMKMGKCRLCSPFGVACPPHTAPPHRVTCPVTLDSRRCGNDGDILFLVAGGWFVGA